MQTDKRMTNEERIRKKTKLIYFMKDITGKVLGKVHISEIKERKGNTKDNGEHKSNTHVKHYIL